ncbi:LTA synthase family protein [Marinospirillum insulare]|uniref:Phosphoglycerol transferase n=1 Tax=Marinospirillum insulare TaxID=217169 RepID=A0ABQ5ZYB0_9GAMM|nr:LTA synthase family protein [Marinospirillum insulare]GLR64367.1 phosphoglycerol transferase [Marinospirillum insulare]
MKQNLSQRWMQWLVSTWLIFIFTLIGLGVFRLLYLYFLGPKLNSLPSNDLLTAFSIGLAFDLKILGPLSGILILLALPFYKLSAGAWRYFEKTTIAYQAVFVVLLNLLGIVNYYYFSFYQSPINALIFGLNEDDTGAVLATLWSDFPTVKLLFALVFFSFLQIYLAIKLAKHLAPSFKFKKAFSITLASILVLVIATSGGIGSSKLRSRHLSVSNNTFINHLVPSGAYALYLAKKERENSQLGNNPNSRLVSLGFTSWQEAAEQCFAEPITSFKQKLTYNHQVEEKPPHVVFAIMEGWGRHLMLFDEPNKNNLLGKLRPWVEGKADYFPQALSVENGTFQSLEGILLDSPITPITQSIYGYQSYDTSRVLPYKKAGYKTVFLTAGPGAWRQLNKTLYFQGFDEVLDREVIINAYPQATTHTWGVDDEWMFKYALDYLKAAEQQGEKVMLVMLSVTNHAPFRIPNHYIPKALDEKMLGNALAVDSKLGRSILETYQYANNSLGDFLQNLEKQNLLSHTLVAASGDHQSRSIITYPDNTQLPLKFGVPLLFYIPKDYKLNKEPINPEIWASHADIFPTLWEHSLSEVEVPLTSDKNIYTRTTENSRATSFINTEGGQGIVISTAGAATNFTEPRYYQWTDTSQLTLTPIAKPTAQLEILVMQEKACLVFKDWRIRNQALEQK